MSHCLVTGATGFVGSAVVRRLADSGRFAVSAVVRQAGKLLPPDVAIHAGLELSGTADWTTALSNVDCVIHAAARVHVMHDVAASSLAAYREINVNGVLALARQSAAAGVRRFVFISSIKVNGEGTMPGHPYTPDDMPAPVDPYGISKFEAEGGLRQLAAMTGMEVVIIRPPLVYGPGVKGNLLSMMRWLNHGVPLPLGITRNKRSLVSLDNLVDLIVTCVDHPAAANEIFLVSDDEDISTTQLLRRMGEALLGKPPRLLAVPLWMLETGAILLGKRDLFQRLCGNLQVDISRTKAVLGWSPPLGLDEGLKLTAKQYLADL